MYPMDPERHSQQREYGEPETCSHQREYGAPETCSQRREYEEPETCSQRREYREPETCSQRREYEEPETCSQRREYREPETCSQRREYEEPETCSQRREYREPETCSQRREYEEPERYSRRREYDEPETCSQRREYREPSSGQWDDGLETRDNGQAMAREPYSEYSSMRRTREGWEEYVSSSDMSFTMDPSSRDWSEDSLRGSGAPFSPDTDGDVDGDPLELSGEDLELLRKRMELEIIEEQIACKKAVLAMDLVGPESKAIRKQKTKDKDLEMLTKNVSNKDDTLKERVNSILRKRAWTNECRSKEAANQQVPPKLVLHPPKVVKSFVERMNESILHKDSIVKGSLTLDIHEEEHPLKLKVEALLEQRRNPTVKEDKAAKGFQYFLDVLNKGVDIDRLSKIVNNFKDLPSMGEELPQGQPPPLDGQPETNSKSERKVPSRKRRSRFDEFPLGCFNILGGQPTLLGVQPNPFGDLLREVVPAGSVLPQHRSLLQSGGGEIGQHSLSLGFIQAMDSPKNKKPKSTQVEEKRKGRYKSKSPPVEERRKERLTSKSPSVEEKRKGRLKSKSPPVGERRKGRLKSKSPPVEEKRKGRLKSKSPPVGESRKGRLKSKSPPVEEKRKERPEDEQKYGQIQSLLQTIGPDLGVEELGRLNDRIQERLYGKKRDLEKKVGKKESVWGVEKEESKKDKEESKKDKEENKKDKEESKKDKEESKKDKEESKKDKEESKKGKEESKKGKEESKKGKEESKKDKEESEKDKQEEEEESEKEKEESEKGKDKEEKACSSKCHSISLLSDSSNSSPPCHRWTAEYKRSSTRDQDTERDGCRSERNRDRRSSTRDQDRERYKGRSERNRDRRSSTRDQDRERYKGRSERNRDRRSSTRDQDRERDGGRSERDRDRRSITRDQDRERDGGRSERNRERYKGRSERNRDQDRERDWGRSERNRDRRSSTRDQDRERDGGRSERDRDRRSSTRDQDRERDWGRSERYKDRERWWERDKDWDGDKESFLGLYPYSNDPTHPHASLMANDSVQYMAYHGSRYASTFPPGCGFPPGTMFPGTMPPGTVPLPHCTSAPGTVPPCPLVQCPPYPLYPNCPPYYYNGTSETFFQPYTQATGNPQFTNTDVQVQYPDASLSIPEQDIETVWPILVHPSMNQDSNPARLNRLSIKMQLKRQRYRINLSNRKNIQELRQLKETPLVAAKVPPSEPGTKKVPEIDAVIEGEKLHYVVPPVATKDSGAPYRTGFPNRKWRKGKILEEKESIFNQGLSMRNRAYMTRWKVRFAEAVAKGLEVPSEPEPKTEPEAEDKSLTEWQRLFADSVENVAATDLFALSEPEAEKKPDWETEQKRTDEEMKAKLKKKLGEFNLKMKQKSTHLKEAPTEAPT
ncbi:myb-like protein X [Salvelinus alpinus]|uniref:myb-like protein X n=1 Tax=Salvelinus alpinus TaxID=8036 RepID=UPI0039FC9EFA